MTGKISQVLSSLPHLWHRREGVSRPYSHDFHGHGGTCGKMHNLGYTVISIGRFFLAGKKYAKQKKHTTILMVDDTFPYEHGLGGLPVVHSPFSDTADSEAFLH